jgi:hypothetical protein
MVFHMMNDSPQMFGAYRSLRLTQAKSRGGPLV